MASKAPYTLPAGGAPVDIVDEMSLTADTDYVLSNVGGDNVAIFEGGAQAPDPLFGHPVPRGGTWYFGVTAASDPVWVWAVNAAKTVWVVSES